jgi:hypothetical protein
MLKKKPLGLNNRMYTQDLDVKTSGTPHHSILIKLKVQLVCGTSKTVKSIHITNNPILQQVQLIGQIQMQLLILLHLGHVLVIILG